MDKIIIDELECFAHHGVYPQEKKEGQPFFVSAVLYSDTSKAGASDDLTLSTDYGAVCHRIDEWMKQNICDLIETVANQLADEILHSFPLVKALDVEVKKPNAPIGLPFKNVSVKIHRGWHEVYLSVGSNMGDRKAFIDGAVQALKENVSIRNVKVSSMLVTKPYGGVEQDDFINAAISLETTMNPTNLLAFLHEIEAKANRKREIHWGPRTLDLDILFYDKLIYEDDELIIPHVDLENRYFVLKPLAEIAPNFRHPILQKTVTQMLSKVNE